MPVPADLRPEEYWIWGNYERGERQLLVIAGGGPKGILYGAYALLRRNGRDAKYGYSQRRTAQRPCDADSLGR